MLAVINEEYMVREIFVANDEDSATIVVDINNKIIAIDNEAMRSFVNKNIKAIVNEAEKEDCDYETPED